MPDTDRPRILQAIARRHRSDPHLPVDAARIQALDDHVCFQEYINCSSFDHFITVIEAFLFPKLATPDLVALWDALSVDTTKPSLASFAADIAAFNQAYPQFWNGPNIAQTEHVKHLFPLAYIDRYDNEYYNKPGFVTVPLLLERMEQIHVNFRHVLISPRPGRPPVSSDYPARAAFTMVDFTPRAPKALLPFEQLRLASQEAFPEPVNDFIDNCDDPAFCEFRDNDPVDKNRVVMLVTAAAQDARREAPTFSQYIDQLLQNKLRSLDFYGQNRCWHCGDQGHRWRHCPAPFNGQALRRTTAAGPPRPAF